MILLAACYGVIGAGVSFAADSAAQIRAVMDKQAAAWNAGDLDGYMAGYWDSPETTFVGGTAVTKGFRETAERYKKKYDSKEKMGALTFSDIEIRVLAADAAFVSGAWKLERAKDSPSGRFTLLFRKFNGEWKIVYDHSV